jgi:hypothetical protein
MLIKLKDKSEELKQKKFSKAIKKVIKTGGTLFMYKGQYFIRTIY